MLERMCDVTKKALKSQTIHDSVGFSVSRVPRQPGSLAQLMHFEPSASVGACQLVLSNTRGGLLG